MNPIDKCFANLKARGEKAFIPFLSAGDPDLDSTVLLARTLAKAGANLLEIGFPYSDPIADGPVIQASYTRALGRGLHLDDVFSCCRRIATENPDVPLAGMVSFSLVYRKGPERFIQKARESGLSGAIVPDLPVEEADDFAQICAKHDFKLVLLVTPTTSQERARRILRTSTGFVYCVSVAGITGERSSIPAELLQQLGWLRGETNLPLCVGFGISKPEHVHTLRDRVDGVIVGSAFIRLLEQPGSSDELAARFTKLGSSLVQALRGSR